MFLPAGLIAGDLILIDLFDEHHEDVFGDGVGRAGKVH